MFIWVFVCGKIVFILDLQRQLTATEEKCQNLEEDKEKLVGLVVNLEIFNRCQHTSTQNELGQAFSFGSQNASTHVQCIC